ncbi:MAG: tetratricopeptide repeat protein [Acidobacteria bacterium]|nr:tetratricopeptide repeat protein [Acidobacteriota bacterium]
MSGKRGAVSNDRRMSQAVEAFDRAMKAFGKKDYEKAAEILDELIAAHPDERDVLERARTYRTLCERAVERRPAYKPKSFEDLLNYGVFLHNRGEYQEALRFFHQAAEIHPKNEHVLYCLAAAAARAGDNATALKSLRSAIAVSPASRAQARSDSDFDPIREEDEFVALVYSAAS